MMQRGKEDDLKKAVDLFASIPEYKDSKVLRLNCEVMIEDLKNQKVYNEALSTLQTGNIRSYKKAIQKLQTIRNWKETKQKIDELYTVLEELENERRFKNQKLKKWAAGGAVALCLLGISQTGTGGNGTDTTGQTANAETIEKSTTSNSTSTATRTGKSAETPKVSQPTITVETSENYYDAETDTFLTGEGYYKLDTGFSYTGSFVDGQPGGDEQAVMVIPDIGTYTGFFLNGERNGKGEFIWLDGTTYTGEWQSDQMNGEGELSLTDGTVYRGTFVNNVLSGKAEISYSNDDVYTGEVKNFRKSGKGTYTWADGASYVGEWEGDQMHNTGIYYFSIDKGKNYLSGSFKDNHPDGTVIYIDKNGNEFTTKWDKGKCVSVEESES